MSNCPTTKDTAMRIRGINWAAMIYPEWRAGITRSSVKFRKHDSCASNSNIRAIMPTLKPSVRRFTSVNAAAVKTPSFVRTARYSIRRDWSASGGTTWIALARKVSTPLTRRLQKQWRKLIGEHALCNELFKIPTVRPRGIRMRLRKSSYLRASRLNATKMLRQYLQAPRDPDESFHNKIRR